MPINMSRTFEGFSVSDAVILNGTTLAAHAAGDMYGVRDGSLDVDVDSYDNTGDEAVLSTWFWFNYANLTITGGYIPFELMALMTGATITSSGTAPADQYSIPLWSEGSLNQATRPVLIRVPSKDANGLARTMDIILYKVQFNPISFDGPAYKDGLIVNYSGRALISTVDEKGVALGTGLRAIGRLVNLQTGPAL